MLWGFLMLRWVTGDLLFSIFISVGECVCTSVNLHLLASENFWILRSLSLALILKL